MRTVEEIKVDIAVMREHNKAAERALKEREQ